MKVGFISLGCSKNLIDTEMGISIFKDNKFEIVSDPKEAEIIVVNTCGFIASAKEEAINTILEMAEYKNENCKYLIAMGCLVKRYKEELEKEIPEVDLWISIDEYKDFWAKVSTLIGQKVDKKANNYMEYRNRTITTGKKQAYLKIAEGCDNFCTYCAIPYIRGRFESRPFEEIIDEAKDLAKNGYEEIIVIAQDTTKYGIDLYGKPRLPELLDKLSKIKGIRWIRFLYAYPESITDELIDVVKTNPKVLHYFDIPIQHFSNEILKKMNRKTDNKSIRNVVSKIRKNIPDVILRTSLIVGFPGETEEDFEVLEKAVKELKFDRLGCFTYSKEDGTPAAKFEGQIKANVKKQRRNKIMTAQNKIAKESLESRVGKTYEVLIEDVTDDELYFVGRSYMDCPDTDGVIFVARTEEDLIDKFVNVKIVAVDEYDLIGEVQK